MTINQLVDTINPGADLGWILRLNQSHVEETSSLDTKRLTHLVATAFLAIACSPEAGFLIAFDERADYASENFRWFQKKFPRFVYIDRVIIAEKNRGQGLAKQMYEKLFSVAKAAGHNRIVCEVNTNPPNPASISFHESMGFKYCGKAKLSFSAKTVRYLERVL
jgi:uncharacterized protein